MKLFDFIYTYYYCAEEENSNFIQSWNVKRLCFFKIKPNASLIRLMKIFNINFLTLRQFIKLFSILQLIILLLKAVLVILTISFNFYKKYFKKMNEYLQLRGLS